MNDRHPSGVPSPDDPGSGFSYGAYDANYGQSAYDTYGAGVPAAGAYDGHSTSSPGGYGHEDPLFGTLPGGAPADTASGTGTYAAGAWDTGAWNTSSWDTGAYQAGYGMGGYDGYDTGSYGTLGQHQAQQPHQAQAQHPGIPAQPDHHYPAPADATGQWTFGVQDTGSWGTGAWDLSGQQPGGYDEYGDYAEYGAPAGTGAPEGYEQTGAYDTYGAAGYGHQQAHGYVPQDGSAAYGVQAEGSGQFEQYGQGHAQHGYGQDASGQWSFTPQHEYDTADTWGFPDTAAHAAPEQGAGFDPAPHEHTPVHGTPAYGAEGALGPDHDGAPHRARSAAFADEPTDDELDAYDPEPEAAPVASTAPHSRGRRRSPKPRRRALMTVAVPSVAVMGVAGVAAASVLGGGDSDKDTSPKTVAAPDEAPVKPSAANSKLDTQLAGLSADADDFANRASRTQERIDLKERQEAERERKAKEAARKEAMRPKFVLPVKDHTLSAHFGQAGVNWMSVHTGIDFPVSYGTPVMAATDGTVTTKYDMSYGNMAIVTAKDGTETWYCHLSSNKIRSGEVKAGDTIAYSGSSGNSTGPHLHFEVRPGGGAAVDPIPWLQGKGLNIS